MDKPATIQADLGNLPVVFWPYQDLRIWTTWSWVYVNGRWTKPPFQPNGMHAKSQGPDTWCTYADALDAVKAKKADGIGIMLCGMKSLEIAIDIDHCRDLKTGEIAAWAREIIDESASYTEVTPSGTGVRIIGQGDIGGIHRRFTKVDGADGGLEVYTAGQARYITITGLQVPGCWPVVSDITAVSNRLVENKGRLRAEQQSLQPLPTKTFEPAPAYQPKLGSLGLMMGRDEAAELDNLIRIGVPQGQRSEQFYRAVGLAKRIGWTPESLDRAMRQNPGGIAAKYLAPDRLMAEISRAWGKVEEADRPDRVQAMQQAVEAITGQPADLSQRKIRTSSFLDLLTDNTPDEPDYIEPNFLGPGNFCLIAGPPKAQKSFLLTEMLVACATGTAFLGGRYSVPRPLKVFYLQAEMGRKLLKKRAQMMTFLPLEQKQLLGKNLIVTERFHMLLNETGVHLAAESIREAFPDSGPDVIAIDPLANLFDGESEDRAPEVMAFLTGRIEALRRAVNPAAAIVMVHHSAKKNSEDMNRDPFVAIRGSGALRGYYDTGVIIYRKSEEAPERKIFIECRNGESPEPITVRLTDRGTFEVQDTSMQGVSKSMADTILDGIRDAWREGKPLSLAPQTRREGRHVGRVMAAKHGLDAQAVDQLVEQWLMNGIVAVEVVDKRTKLKGLKVIGRINAEV